MTDLFDAPASYQPLADRRRPKTVEDYLGQEHLLSEGQPLRLMLDQGLVHSMILWGPPGVGKTSLAKMIADTCEARFHSISAVLSGVKEIREAIALAEQERAVRPTVLFVDEVHRFNKAQQDAFLPHIENGTIIFVGATTENPSFELNNALLSRCRVYLLKPLDMPAIESVITGAIPTLENLRATPIVLEPDALNILVRVADGDARTALNLLEIAVDASQPLEGKLQLNIELVQQIVQQDVRRFDKGGDLFYEQISALHKSVRGSNTDGALYWFARMVDGGCDPLYIARRVVRMASEDIGNADPRALQISLNAWDTQERLGSPEGELAIAQAVAYLAAAPKSNAVYSTYKSLMRFVKDSPSYDVPMHLRNAPTKLMKDMEFGTEYRYAHDYPDAFAAGEGYLPREISHLSFYEPTNRGLEQKIGDKLDRLKQLDSQSEWQRYPQSHSAKKES